MSDVALRGKLHRWISAVRTIRPFTAQGMTNVVRICATKMASVVLGGKCHLMVSVVQTIRTLIAQGMTHVVRR